jgi:hypothetical protein
MNHREMNKNYLEFVLKRVISKHRKEKEKDNDVSYILEQWKGHQRKRTKEREMEKKMTFAGLEPPPSAIRVDVVSHLD